MEAWRWKAADRFGIYFGAKIYLLGGHDGFEMWEKKKINDNRVMA